VGILWWYQSQFAPSSPFETIYYPGETLPSLARIPTKLWTLFAPRQLVALFGLPKVAGGWALGWAFAVTICGAAWIGRKNPATRMALTFLGAFLLVYSLVRFTVWAPPSPEVAPPGSMRYAAPIYGLCFVILSLGAGTLWGRGQRAPALLILLPALTVGSVARSAHFSGPFPDKTVFSISATDFEYSRDQLSYLLTLSEHQSCTTTESDAVAFHAFGIAWAETRQVLDKDPDASFSVPPQSHFAAFEGMASALLSEVDGDSDGGTGVLEAIDARIRDASDEMRFEILAAACKRRDWLEGLPEHGGLRFAAFARQVNHLPPLSREALAHSMGHRWAEDVLRWRTPYAIELPNTLALEQPLDQRFISGFAEVLGERWGPGPHPVSGLEDKHLAAWDSGLERGLSRRWITQSH